MKEMLVFVCVALMCVVGLGAQDAPKQRAPIIDMHLHALPAQGWPGGPSVLCPGMEFAAFDPSTKWDPNHLWETCPDPLIAPATDEELMREILAVMDRRNIVLAATSGSLEHVRRYRRVAPSRMLPALNVAVANLGTPNSLRELILKGEIAILGEIAPQHEGISPDDEALEPYYALAEEMDIPLAIHMGVGPPGAAYYAPRYRAALNNPLLLEKMLVRHPKLRVYVMHAGWPMLDEMMYLLLLYPQVYADVSAINWLLPRPEFHRYLRTLVQAGFGKRLMFGSDASMWPQTMTIGIEAIESADFLTEAQKRDIFYNNAARFLRLDEKGQPQKRPREAK